MKKLFLILFLITSSSSIYALSLSDIWHMDIGDIISTVVFWSLIYAFIIKGIPFAVEDFFKQRREKKASEDAKISKEQLRRKYAALQRKKIQREKIIKDYSKGTIDLLLLAFLLLAAYGFICFVITVIKSMLESF